MKTSLIAKGSIFLAAVVSILATAAPSFAYDGCGWGAHHPARREVLRRDAHLNRELNHDYGHLNGQYGRLKAEDASIRRQEQFDAAMNGGHLTHGETVRLNHEENTLQRQINNNLR